MEPRLTLFSIIMLLGSAHGLFLALALVNTKSGSKTGHFFLALLTLAFAIDLGHEFLYQSRYLLNALMLAYVDPIINFVYGPSLYLYVRALTEGSDFKLKGTGWLHFLPVAIGIAVSLLLPDLSPEQFTKLFYDDEVAVGREEGIVQSAISSIAMASVISLGTYLVLSIRRLMRHAKRIRQQFSSIERVTLNWLRNLLIAISVLYLILIFGGFFAQTFGLNESINNLLYLMIVTVIYAMGYLGLRQPVIFTGPALDADNSSKAPVQQINEENTGISLDTDIKYKTSSLDSEMSAALRTELQHYMEVERPHLDSKLTLPQLAKQIGISPNYLSQVINEQYKKNFFDFINDYRVEEAKRLLTDSTKANLSIVSVAYESGFNSKSAFYTAFKKNAGITPTNFRTSAANEKH